MPIIPVAIISFSVRNGCCRHYETIFGKRTEAWKGGVRSRGGDADSYQSVTQRDFLARRSRGERHVPRVNGAVLAPSKAAHLHAFNRRLVSLMLSDARTLDTVSLPIGHIYSLDPRKIRNFMTQRLGFKVVGRHTLIKSGCHWHGTPG